MRQRFHHRPFFFLLPFLLLYCLIIALNNSALSFGDEPRYLTFASNLINGFYSPPPPGINLWNGPGFPLYLVPFLWANIPIVVIKFCNALLYYLALVLIFKSLRSLISQRSSVITTVIAGLYYMPYKSLPHVLSEIFTIFLIALIVFLSSGYFEKNTGERKWLVMLLLALSLSWLALTKVIFGPVFLLTALFFLLLYIISRNIDYRKSFFVLVCALLLCSPYLFYTYSLTGRIFYWSNAGGMSLYWMSNPSDGEYGEWYNDSIDSPHIDEASLAILKSNHMEDFQTIDTLNGIARDDKFREIAFRNISEHPGKYILNWLSNCSRMLFNYPVGYRPVQTGTIGNMVANIPVFVLLLFSFAYTIRRKKQLPGMLKFLLPVSGIYLLVSSFFSAYDRMFYILLPVFAVWIAWTLENYLKKKEV